MMPLKLLKSILLSTLLLLPLLLPPPVSRLSVEVHLKVKIGVFLAVPSPKTGATTLPVTGALQLVLTGELVLNKLN